MARGGRVCDMSLDRGAYFILALPTLLFAILSVAAAYHIAGGVDVGVVVRIVAMRASNVGSVTGNYLLRWCIPLVPTMSDDFSNVRLLRECLYSRLFWLPLLLGVWLLASMATMSTTTLTSTRPAMW